MSAMHCLKIDTEHYRAIKGGLKKFEIRKNDRDFQVGDYVLLNEAVNGELTDQEIMVEIEYILKGGKYGLEKGYCIFNW